MDVTCVSGEKTAVMAMKTNDRAVEQIVGACCRGEIPVEDGAFRAASDEDRAIGCHANAGKVSTTCQDLGLEEKDGTYGRFPFYDHQDMEPMRALAWYSCADDYVASCQPGITRKKYEIHTAW